MSSVSMVKDNFVSQLVQSEEIFQTIPEWSPFTQGDPRKRQKTMSHWPEHFHENLVPLPTYLSFLKTFPTKMKPSKCPAREKKMRQEKPKRRGREEEKSKSQECCVTFQPKTCIKILLSAHAWTLQANGLHLDQKAPKCTTCKRLCGKF